MWLANGLFISLIVSKLSKDAIANRCFSTIDGNYREYRHFTPWQRPQETEDYYLEQIVGKITGQYKVPFGDAVISTRDTCLGLETCEELFTPNGCVNHYPSAYVL